MAEQTTTAPSGTATRGPGETSAGAGATTGRYRTAPVSFVRRSRPLPPAQQRAWDEQRPRYLVDVPRATAATSVDPGWVLDPAVVFGRRAPLVVEIGSGQGDQAVAAAAAAPGRDLLAVEVYEPGLARTARRAASGGEDGAGLDNLRLVQANAIEVLATALPAASAEEVWVFFPDPWRKARHTKRRLVDGAFLDAAARVLAPGGRLRFASDWEPYAHAVRELLAGHPAFGPDPAADADGWSPRFAGRVLTAFERKGLAAGRPVHDLVGVRRADVGAEVSRPEGSRP